VSVSLAALDAQEALFAAAFASGDIFIARSLYATDVIYLSPTTRLFDWPARIVGVERTLEFIGLTITGLSNITYGVDERAIIPGPAEAVGDSGDAGDPGAYVRVRFDFDMSGTRLRSTYVVVYRYRDGRIGQQELYYDPSAELDRLPSS
jgi:ketosteroid isomerase-like protein